MPPPFELFPDSSILARSIHARHLQDILTSAQSRARQHTYSQHALVVSVQAKTNSIVDEPLSSSCRGRRRMKFGFNDTPFASPAHALLSSRLIFRQLIQ